MSLLIRPSGVADAAGVLSLWRDADAEPTHTDNLASITALICHDPGALIVAEDQGRIVGSIIAGWDGWRGSVYRLAVGPDDRRRGLGGQLLDAAESRLATLGAQRLQAIVVETDQRATGFWRASDWEQQADRLRFVKG
jgi:ribosomal protein S18 acetylase RimI-like enzyme